MFYGVKISKTDTGYRLTCRDLPGYFSDFPTEAEAEDFIRVFVPTCLMTGYRKKRRAYPLPTPVRDDEIAAYIPMRSQAKILFWNFLLSEGIRLVDAAKKLGIQQSEVGRMTNIATDEASVDKVEWAIKELGAYLTTSSVKLPADSAAEK